MEKEYETFEAQVIDSHIVKCPVCDGNQGVVLIWNDGDVDLICIGCKHKERLSFD
ncbi:MAG: hypothetical protein GX334_05455 [Firmicutes bacterium]|nr:hypothetical protein [Bacillota bacterium]